MSMSSKSRLTALLGVAFMVIGLAKADGKGSGTDELPKPVLESLFRGDLLLADNLEIIMSRVEVPPNSSLPRHTHPGEEFAYLMEGEVTYVEAGQPDRVVTVGEAVKVPIDTVHTVHTGDIGATIVVFRVHPKGLPERVPVD